MSLTKREGRSLQVGELIFAVGLAALGALALTQAHTINVPISGADVGPRVFPYLIGGVLTVLGIALVVQILRGRIGEAEEGEDVDTEAGTSWLTVGMLIVTIVVHVFLIIPIGWPFAAAVLFTGCAWVLGARPLWRAPIIGLVLALVIQWVFGGLLGLSLPPGPLLEGLEVFRG